MTCAGRSETCWNQSWKRGTIRRFLGSFDYQDSWIMIFPQNDPIGKFAREIIGTNPFTPGWRLCWTRDGTITLRDTILQGETSNLVADWRFHPLWDSTEKKNQCNHLYFYIMWIYIYSLKKMHFTPSLFIYLAQTVCCYMRQLVNLSSSKPFNVWILPSCLPCSSLPFLGCKNFLGFQQVECLDGLVLSWKCCILPNGHQIVQ